jgi:hypothetical protein
VGPIFVQNKTLQCGKWETQEKLWYCNLGADEGEYGGMKPRISKGEKIRIALFVFIDAFD